KALKFEQKSPSKKIKLCYTMFKKNSNLTTRKKNIHNEEAMWFVMTLATLGGPIQHLEIYLTWADIPGNPRAERE
ncbi:hypothetical protein VP01_7642g1, partial [Puccinia sorghi]